MNIQERRRNKDKIKSMSGFKVHWGCVRLMQCYSILQENSKELVKYSSNPPRLNYKLLADIRSRIQKNVSDCEVGRLIHNYVASVKTLVDISRRYSRKYLSENLKVEYNKIVYDTFENDLCSKIIHRLRDFMLHVDFPEITNQINIFTGVSSYLALPPEKLLDWDKWNEIERNYLETLVKNGKTIKINEFFLAYTDKSKYITYVLLKYITENNNNDLSEVYDLHDQILESVKATNCITDPLFVHFFSRNEQYDIEGNIVPLFQGEGLPS